MAIVPVNWILKELFYGVFYGAKYVEWRNSWLLLLFLCREDTAEFFSLRREIIYLVPYILDNDSKS